MTILLFVIIPLIIVLLIGYFVSMYNSLVSVKNNINKAWSNIDILLKQRHDELSKILASVKGYMSYEQEVLVRVTQARSAYAHARTIKEKANADDVMSSTLKSLFAVSENYPELKANQMFVQFQSRITEIESQIADRREFYNDSVNTFNTRIEQLPEMFIAKMLDYTSRELFKVALAERQDVSIKL